MYLDDNTSMIMANQMQSELESIVGVNDVRFISKTQALDQWREEWGENAYLLDGLSTNPAPKSIYYYARKFKICGECSQIINDMNGVDEVVYAQDMIKYILQITGL